MCRYGQPKHCREGTERQFGDLYAAECMAHFLDAHLGLMSALASGAYFSPRATNMLFQVREGVREGWGRV